MMAAHAYPGHQREQLAQVLINPNLSNVIAFVPYIVTLSVEELDQLYSAQNTTPVAKIWHAVGRDSWMQIWPEGIRYETRCRFLSNPISFGLFPSLREALERARPFIALRRGMQ